MKGALPEALAAPSFGPTCCGSGGNTQLEHDALKRPLGNLVMLIRVITMGDSVQHRLAGHQALWKDVRQQLLSSERVRPALFNLIS